MKVTKVLLLAAVLVLALAVTAMATEAKWSFTTNISGGASSGCQLGTDSSATTMNASAVSATAAGCYAWFTGQTRFVSYSNLTSITAANPIRTWTTYAWVGESYASSTATITWKSSTTVPTSIASVPYTLKIKILTDPTGTYTAGTEWNLSGLTSTVVTGPTFSNLNAIKYTQVIPEGKTSAAYDLAPLANGKSVQMQVTMAPTASAVPEPGSMLALATGLIGLAGGIFRKRS
ncbi:MAG: PEP-CTERM sorting domain-containing protein [Armatimonadota bacterium]